MFDKRTLINMALAHLAEERVSQADLEADPPSPKVEKMLAAYDLAAAVAQSRAPWQCCLQFGTLTASTTLESDWRHDQVFALPDDALNVWLVNSHDGDDEAWTQAVAVDAQGAAVKVIRTSFGGPIDAAWTRLTPEAGWDPLLADAFAFELAARTAGPIKADDQLAERLERKAQQAYAAARGAEASRERGQTKIIATSGMTAARLAGNV